MNNNIYDVLIIGAGASGLMCASSLVREYPSIRVLVIDKNGKAGRKLLATGNGRCNFTNLNIASSCYNTDDVRKLTKILHSFNSKKIIDYFEKKLGVVADYKGDLVYPITYQSKTVADALEASCKGVRFLYNTEVTSVVKKDIGYFINGMYEAHNVVFACGGVSYPELGSNGSLYPIIRGLAGEDSIERLIPSLVPLKSSDKDIKALAGIRQECTVRLNGAAEKGEILFAEYGVSGICVMQLSGNYNRSIAAGKKAGFLSVDLLPSMDAKRKILKIEELMRAFPDRSPEDALSGLLKKPLASVVVGRSDGTPADIARIAGDFRINLIGSLGFENAQVTSGGLKLKKVNDGLELLNCPGIYVCGEALNVDGICGGYNLHWAWASALTVADSILEDMDGI
ncbi:MAG: aminoacetone oxidase family FAD-binding enzyme [Clostridiales bacterium]|nr:aminoacetone oxidase family FAD-binding enzyme [Clostridiales bacterium]